ncbi:MAG: peptide chain release factor H [Cellvibrionaceae bacterium]
MMDNKWNKKNKDIVWLQLTAGQGPKECAWVVAQLLKKIRQEASKTEIHIEMIESLAFDKLLRHQHVIEVDAYLSILLRLKGKDAEFFAQQWEGTIKWQGESPYRPKHKRINWFVGAALVPVVESQKIDLKTLEKEVDFESMKAKGPGGQHVNKTNSAVRITHKPTGLQVRIETDRSQHRNKKIALERLQLLLMQKSGREKTSIEQTHWSHHYDVKRGSPIRTFFGKEFVENS